MLNFKVVVHGGGPRSLEARLHHLQCYANGPFCSTINRDYLTFRSILWSLRHFWCNVSVTKSYRDLTLTDWWILARFFFFWIFVHFFPWYKYGTGRFIWIILYSWLKIECICLLSAIGISKFWFPFAFDYRASFLYTIPLNSSNRWANIPMDYIYQTTLYYTNNMIIA